MTTNKPILQLVGLDGNAFSVMGAWKNAARKAGWTKEEQQKVLDEAMSGDYNHLLATIMDNCEDPTEDEVPGDADFPDDSDIDDDEEDSYTDYDDEDDED